MYFKGVKERQVFEEWIERSRAKKHVEQELYRLKRYGSPITIGIYRCADSCFEDKFYIYSRRTDHLIPLAEHHFMILFGHTEISGAVKAVENLMIYMEPEEKERVALTQLREDDGIEDGLKRVLTLFVLACRGEDSIVDDSYLGR